VERSLEDALYRDEHVGLCCCCCCCCCYVL